jgi:hypothetical protein
VVKKFEAHKTKLLQQINEKKSKEGYGMTAEEFKLNQKMIQKIEQRSPGK